MSNLSGGFVDLLSSLCVSAGGLGSLGFLLGAMLPPAGASAALLARRVCTLYDWELVVIIAVTSVPLYLVDWRLFVGSLALTTVVYKSVTSILRRYVRQYIRHCIRFYMRQFAANSRLVRRILDDGDGEDDLQELLDGEEEQEEGEEGDGEPRELARPPEPGVAGAAGAADTPRRVRTRSSLTLPHPLHGPSAEPTGRLVVLQL